MNSIQITIMVMLALSFMFNVLIFWAYINDWIIEYVILLSMIIVAIPFILSCFYFTGNLHVS